MFGIAKYVAVRLSICPSSRHDGPRTCLVAFVDQVKLAVHAHFATTKHAIIPILTSPPASKNVSSR